MKRIRRDVSVLRVGCRFLLATLSNESVVSLVFCLFF